MTMTPRENDEALENEEELAEIVRDEDVQEEAPSAYVQDEAPPADVQEEKPRAKKKVGKQPEDRLIVSFISLMKRLYFC